MRRVTPKHPEHSGNQPENQGQPRAITRKALGFLLPPQSPWDSHLLYIRVGISIWENIRVFLAEDVAHSAAGDNLEAAATHPHSEGDFCKTGVPPHHGSVPSRGEGTQDGSIGAPGPRKWSAAATLCVQPRTWGLRAGSTVRLCALLAGQPQFPLLQMTLTAGRVMPVNMETNGLARRSTFMGSHIRGPAW